MNSMNINVKKAKVQYSQQRCMAGKRGIEFKLTFQEWIDWWIQTGHYADRGRGRGKYVMCRYNDCGAYELGNIYCDTHKSNLQSAHKDNKYNQGRILTEEHKNAIGYSQKGSKNHCAKKVKINGKIYDCIKDAAADIGIGYSLCRKRMRTQHTGYEYI